MKNLFVILLFICVSIGINAQEIENPKFRLQATNVTQELQLQTNPVDTSEIFVAVFTAGDKKSNVDRIGKRFTMHRGKAIHKIDVSQLSAGAYFVEVVEKGKKVFRKKIIKK